LSFSNKLKPLNSVYLYNVL